MRYLKKIACTIYFSPISLHDAKIMMPALLACSVMTLMKYMMKKITDQSTHEFEL